MKAEFPGNCFYCGGPIYFGEEIQIFESCGNEVACHIGCMCATQKKETTLLD